MGQIKLFNHLLCLKPLTVCKQMSSDSFKNNVTCEFACKSYIYVNINIYIVIHRQICCVLSEFVSVTRHTNFPLLGSKPG